MTPPTTRSRTGSESSKSLKLVPPSEDDITWFNTAVTSGSDKMFEEENAMIKLMKMSLSTALSTQHMLASVSEQNQHLKTRVSELEDRQMVLEQYSRKSVAIVTGLPQQQEESTSQLQRQVLELLNAVKTPSTAALTMKDFSAIHRNGKGKNGRPPSVTVKFLGLHEKELFFVKSVKSLIKARNANIHHCLCPAMIDNQRRIEQHSRVDFVFYSGPFKHFVAKLDCGDFVSYCRNYNDFLTKIEQHVCS